MDLILPTNSTAIALDQEIIQYYNIMINIVESIAATMMMFGEFFNTYDSSAAILEYVVPVIIIAFSLTNLYFYAGNSTIQMEVINTAAFLLYIPNAMIGMLALGLGFASILVAGGSVTLYGNFATASVGVLLGLPAALLGFQSLSTTLYIWSLQYDYY
jgi:hypothetical protein